MANRDLIKEAQLPSFEVACEPLPRYALREVARHDRRDDAWIVVEDLVYDITSFINHHPGWTNGGQTSTVLAIMKNLGCDCTEEFQAIHTADAKALLPRFLVGRVGVVGDKRLPEEVLREVARWLPWRDVASGVVAWRDLWRACLSEGVLLRGAEPVEQRGLSRGEEGHSSGYYRKTLTQSLGYVEFDAILSPWSIFAVKIERLRALQLHVGANFKGSLNFAFDCAGSFAVKPLGRAQTNRSYGRRVPEGATLALTVDDKKVARYFVDGRCLGAVDLFAAASAEEESESSSEDKKNHARTCRPFVVFQNAPDDAVSLVPHLDWRVVSQPPEAAAAAAAHPLDGRLVVKMLGPDATDFIALRLDPRKATVAKLRRHLRTVLRSRKQLASVDCDFQILAHDHCLEDDPDRVLADLGILIHPLTKVQSVDLYYNLPHTVS